jgi:hypothetical protein
MILESKSKNSTEWTTITRDQPQISNIFDEPVELKGIVQTKGVIQYKSRFAILTTKRLLLFENKNQFLLKKTPRVHIL